MKRLIYSVAMSLDGYIAGPEGEYDWILMDPDIDFGAIMGAFDTVVMGRKSYELTLQQPDEGSLPKMDTYVFSRSLKQEDCPGVTVSDTPRETLAALKTQAGKDIWLFGGGALFASLLGMGLVDKVEVAIIPILLGGGLPFLPPPVSSSPLTLISQRVYEKTGTVSLEYEVRS